MKQNVQFLRRYLGKGVFKKWTHIYPPPFTPAPSPFFWFLIRSTDLGDYIYIHTLRTHIGNRTWKPRALLDVQFLHTFPAFCLLFCVSIGFAFDSSRTFCVGIIGRAIGTESAPLHAGSFAYAYTYAHRIRIHGSDADLSPL